MLLRSRPPRNQPDNCMKGSDSTASFKNTSKEGNERYQRDKSFFQGCVNLFETKEQMSQLTRWVIQSSWLQWQTLEKDWVRRRLEEPLINCTPTCLLSKSLMSLWLEFMYWRLDPEKSQCKWGLGREVRQVGAGTAFALRLLMTSPWMQETGADEDKGKPKIFCHNQLLWVYYS